jgi:GT2 family glycosyltransferase
MLQASIVICTFNRNRELAATLEGIQNQSINRNEFETIVVDNSEESFARLVVEQVKSKFPNLIYQHEPRIGLSNARNLGVSAAQGEWVIYLDDDAVPEEKWLENLFKCLNTIDKMGVVGGSVLPVWPTRIPGWLTNELFPYLSISEYNESNELVVLDFPDEYPVGASIAYPRELLEKYCGFNSKLGRKGNLLLSGEETELNLRLHNDGYPIYHCPQAIVHHQIHPTRLSKSFFRSRYYWSGRTWALIHSELFGEHHIKKELLRRFLIGLTIDTARWIYYGILIRRNPFLIELYLRETIGYIQQGLLLMGKSNQPK